MWHIGATAVGLVWDTPVRVTFRRNRFRRGHNPRMAEHRAEPERRPVWLVAIVALVIVSTGGVLVFMACTA